jgi:Protein of unknown function (DUF3616)
MRKRASTKSSARRMGTARLIPAALLLGALGVPGAGGQERNQAPSDYRLAQDLPFTREAADELSGIACRTGGAATGSLFCLVVDNEARSAQTVTIEVEKRLMTPGRLIPLVGKARPEGVIGSEPQVQCPGGRKGYGEFDGEGVAYDGTWFYVVGSHGCTRKDAEYRPSMFLLARMRLDDQGRVQGEVQRTFRLAEALQRAPEARPHFAKKLMLKKDEQGPEPNGLNIEGIAAMDGRLLFGLRAPSLNSGALVLDVAAEDLFKPDAQLSPRLSHVEIGENAGIRDMAVLPDKRLLILSGPAQEQAGVQYALWAVARRSDGHLEGRPERLHDDVGWSDKAIPGAEAVAVVGCEGDTLRALVFYDGVENGGAREYRIPLRGACPSRN